MRNEPEAWNLRVEELGVRQAGGGCYRQWKPKHVGVKKQHVLTEITWNLGLLEHVVWCDMLRSWDFKLYYVIWALRASEGF